ncbi:MAG: ParA family protein [Dokdonella sp.]
MRTILVASSKGGCGKTTIATNLAAYYAIKGEATVLVDTDRQQSSQRWCAKRADMATPVLPLDGTRRRWPERIPEGAQRVIIDVPAGIASDELERYADHLDAIVVPVLPSVIDLEASASFLADLAELKAVKKGKLPVALVANRLKPWTNSSQIAVEAMRELPFPLVAHLRDSQAYVLMAGLGRSIFDYHSEAVRGHQADWLKLLKWIGKH